ncbi:hypothetical protein GDO78_009610 [Eleutherodactylus coqui]|uniref:P2X purinoreceptor 7 intracellular domain-containing protein n=2 Tax=Eleutherodactylus coqui TaxID=57060 RepID=A0A8J6FAA8_ELECQ|nr:hypothetical protein GDO78_009610 [Eleutherodactylus coqui]
MENLEDEMEFDLDSSCDTVEEDDYSDVDEAEDVPQRRQYTEVQQQLVDSLHAMADGISVQCFQNDPQGTPEEGALGSTEDPDGRLSDTKWCQCGQCMAMKTVAECLCCREQEVVLQILPDDCMCITKHPLFEQYALLRENIEHTIRLCYMFTRRKYDLTNNRDMRVGAYRSYIAWIHGFLGKRNRVPIPACVIKVIRNLYPGPEEDYTSFQFYMDLAENNLDFGLNL